MSSFFWSRRARNANLLAINKEMGIACGCRFVISMGTKKGATPTFVLALGGETLVRSVRAHSIPRILFATSAALHHPDQLICAL